MVRQKKHPHDFTLKNMPKITKNSFHREAYCC